MIKGGFFRLGPVGMGCVCVDEGDGDGGVESDGLKVAVDRADKFNARYQGVQDDDGHAVEFPGSLGCICFSFGFACGGFFYDPLFGFGGGWDGVFRHKVPPAVVLGFAWALDVKLPFFGGLMWLGCAG